MGEGTAFAFLGRDSMVEDYIVFGYHYLVTTDTVKRAKTT